MIKEIGIGFTKENRGLTRADLKTETRRTAKVSIELKEGAELPWRCFRREGIHSAECFRSADELADHCSPYGGKGNPVRYYVQEPVQVLDLATDRATIRYQDDGAEASVIITPGDYQKLMARKDWRRPSTGRFMLKSFARTWLKRERLWVEKLGDLTVEGAIAEGIELNPDLRSNLASGMESLSELGAQPVWRDYLNGGYDLLPVQSYASLWNSINGAGSWNPEQWVWCIQYSKEN